MKLGGKNETKIAQKQGKRPKYIPLTGAQSTSPGSTRGSPKSLHLDVVVRKDVKNLFKTRKIH